MEPKKEVITVENLLNSLGQIEIWIKAVRTALATLDKKQELRLPATMLAEWTKTAVSPLRTSRECPPPD
jgi:hypothetical protein